MRIGEVEKLTGSIYRLEKSSLPGPHLIGEIGAGESKKMKLAMLMTGQGKRLFEMAIYTQEHNDNGLSLNKFEIFIYVLLKYYF